MNYLAHLYLGRKSSPHMVGALLGDFARGLDLALLPAEVRAGVEHHRMVDRYTDSHSLVRKSRARVSPRFSRLSGILVDVFYDHFLARHWTDVAEGTLAGFAQGVYAVLGAHRANLPERLAHILPRMASEDWLSGYGDLEGVHAALRGLERRLKRPSGLGGAIDDLRREYGGLEADFLEFFPQVKAMG